MNLSVVSLMCLPLLFLTWVTSDPQNAKEQVRSLHRKVCYYYARREAKAIIQREYTHIDKHQNEAIEQLTHKLYWQRVADNNCA